MKFELTGEDRSVVECEVQKSQLYGDRLKGSSEFRERFGERKESGRFPTRSGGFG